MFSIAGRVHEVFGPVLAKIALDRAGEIDIKRTAK